MIHIFKTFLKQFLLITLITLPLFSGTLDDITKTMNEKVGAIMDTLKDPKLLKCEKNVKISKLTEGMFDYTLMSRLSIGKRNWSKFTPQQKKEFTQLFTTRMKQSYIEKAHLLSDEKVSVHDAIQLKATRIHQLVVIHGSDKDTEIKYKYHKTKLGKWLIYDVEIAKISILKTYRAQFAEKLSSASVAELIEKLKESSTEKIKQ